MYTQNRLSDFKPISGAKGTFAYFTIKERLPSILSRLIREHEGNLVAISNLNHLCDNIRDGKIGELTNEEDESWEKYIEPFLGLSWQEAPFYFVEAYFYQKVLESVDYFNTRKDPFHHQKIEDINAHLEEMQRLSALMDQKLISGKSDVLTELLHLNLWGNKADLSQIKINRNSTSVDHNIIDDSGLVLKYLEDGVSRIDVVLDNSGLELFTDLLLAVCLIKMKMTDQVVLHAKAYPTFVSDATEVDIDILLEYLGKKESSGRKTLGQQFKGYECTDQIVVKSHKFWNAPLHFFEIPSDLHKTISESDLLIFKGDANYRRIFGDRIIPSSEKVQQFADYLPAKSLAIRILKSEILLGLSAGQKMVLDQSHQAWLTCGQYGVIQMLN